MTRAAFSGEHVACMTRSHPAPRGIAPRRVRAAWPGWTMKGFEKTPAFLVNCAASDGRTNTRHQGEDDGPRQAAAFQS